MMKMTTIANEDIGVDTVVQDNVCHLKHWFLNCENRIRLGQGSILANHADLQFCLDLITGGCFGF